MTKTFYWHDYETWGADPRRDRAAQFAGLRTDEDLNPVGDPLVLFCRPADDLLPQPEACLITGITPQRAEREGVIEAELAAAIQAELARPGTCGVGYNSMRFDDEVTRNLLYRNFFDPYAREWQNGNSRWDLIDTVRLAHALRPEGIEWPQREDGATSFKLEHLTAANGIGHAQAHDALADVRATIALARLVKAHQPRLFDYALSLRAKRRVAEMLAKGEALLHVSARYPAEQGCIAPVLPIARHPVNSNGVIVFDLRHDPGMLADLSEEEIRERLFTPARDLPEGVARIPLKTVHVNRSPVLAPMSTLTAGAGERWGIDPGLVDRHARALAAEAGIQEKVQRVHATSSLEPITDPDQMIYAGGFFPDADRREMERVRALDPASLARETFIFEDERLPEMLFRYRARNWAESLTDAEREEWDAYRLVRLTETDGGGSIILDDYERRLVELRPAAASEPERLRVIDALEQWAERVMDSSG
ncbi:MAG: exodeoxyribonuclease I [Pseudomonadota bacterium]|nr:exodeoxyribonuclease I [Pseudomonadota bacterium]